MKCMKNWNSCIQWVSEWRQSGLWLPLCVICSHSFSLPVLHSKTSLLYGTASANYMYACHITTSENSVKLLQIISIIFWPVIARRKKCMTAKCMAFSIIYMIHMRYIHISYTCCRLRRTPVCQKMSPLSGALRTHYIMIAHNGKVPEQHQCGTSAAPLEAT